MSAAVTAAAAAAVLSQQSQRRASRRSSDESHHSAAVNSFPYSYSTSVAAMVSARSNRQFENQMRQDWSAFLQYLRNNGLVLSQLDDDDILEFLEYLQQFGKTKVHQGTCALYGRPSPPAACTCPLRQPWASVNALVRRLRIAFDETKGRTAANPFNAPAVTLYLAQVKEEQSRARGIVYY